MRYASVCSGVDAATLAWMPLDWKPVFYSEIEPFPCAVLKHHYPETPNLGDMTKINGKDYHGKVDLLVGGTPCQSYSVAGLRKGLADPRGQLSLVFTRLAYEMGVQWTVWENVPGVLSQDNGGAFSAILSSLAGCVITTPREGWSSTGFIRNFRRDRFGLAWRVLDAQYVRVDGFRHAVPQRRLRLFVVGYFGDWRRAAAVLFEPQMLLGDTAPERKTREEVAGGFNESITGADNEGGRNTVCLSSGNSNMGIMENVCPVIAASPDRKRLRCVIDMRQLEVAEEEISPTLVATDYKGGKAVCEETRQITYENHGTDSRITKVDVSPTITRRCGTGGNNLPLVQRCGVFNGSAGADNEGGRSTGLICVHGSQDPINNPGHHANAVGRNNGLENVICLSSGQANAERMKDCCPTLSCLHEVPIVINDQGGDFITIEKNGVAGTLRANTHGNEQVVCYENHDLDTRIRKIDVAPSILAGAGKLSSLPLVQRCGLFNGNAGAKSWSIAYSEEVSPILTAEGKPPCVAFYPKIPAYAIVENIIGRKDENGANGVGAQEEVAYTQNAFGVMGVATYQTVRRLMPIECERLMGFPDNYTMIPWNGKPAEQCPNSHRYKACGNSMCVNVMRWIGRRIDMVENSKTDKAK